MLHSSSVDKLGFELKTVPFSPLSASSLCWAAGAVKQKPGMFVLVLTRTQPANTHPGRTRCLTESVVTLQRRQYLTWVWSQLCSYKQNDFADPSHLLSLSFP